MPYRDMLTWEVEACDQLCKEGRCSENSKKRCAARDYELFSRDSYDFVFKYHGTMVRCILCFKKTNTIERNLTAPHSLIFSVSSHRSNPVRGSARRRWRHAVLCASRRQPTAVACWRRTARCKDNSIVASPVLETLCTLVPAD